MSMGGIVPHPRYLSGGGMIPRGTDTVPAMLTPGEGVMRREAVSRLMRGDWPISIITTMIGTDITPLMMALHTRALIGSTSSAPMMAPSAVATMMIFSSPYVNAGQRLADRDRMFDALRANRWVAMLADQDARRHGVFVPFFGVPAATVTVQDCS